MMDTNILVIGGANIDLVATVPRCPRPGETLIGSTFKTVPGGKGGNQAVAAARLGAKTYLGGCVGSDTFGEMLRTTLSQAGVLLDHLKSHPGEPTGTALIFVGDDGQNSIGVIPAANLGISPADIQAMAPLFAQLDAILLQLEVPMETVDATLDLAQANGVLSILDAGPAQQVAGSIIAKASIVSPNETEAEAITGIAVTDIQSAKAAAERLRQMGAAEVVLKLGAQGAYYLGQAGGFHVPPFSITPVDTVAAGDAFTAALGCTWNAMPPREAIRFANAAGAMATTVEGAQPSMPTRATVEKLLQEQT